MKRNIIAICLVFALLMSFAACKKLPQDNEFVIESQVYVVDDAGVTHNVQSEYDENGKQVFYYLDYNGNKVIVNNKTQNTEKDEELDSMHGGNNNLC